jgi:hypothetical protein
MSQVKQGQKLVVKNAYSARGFAARPDEAFPTEYSAFDRTGREAQLVQLTSGEALVALTNSNGDGYLYARAQRDGRTLACVVVPDSYSLG